MFPAFVVLYTIKAHAQGCPAGKDWIARSIRTDAPYILAMPAAGMDQTHEPRHI
jgi:hypothetical protein